MTTQNLKVELVEKNILTVVIKSIDRIPLTNLWDLDDVSIISALDKQVLMYDAVLKKWQNQDILSSSVTSVFGRTGDIVATTGDYDWASIDKSISDLADLTTKKHASLQVLVVQTTMLKLAIMKSMDCYLQML